MPQWFVEIHRGPRHVYHRVIHDRVKIPFFRQHRMIAIEKEIPYDRHLRRIPAIRAARNRARSIAASDLLVHVHENIPFHVRVRSIQIQHIIAPAGKNIIQHLQNRTRPLSTGKIDNIIQPRRGSECVAFDNRVTSRADSHAMNRLGVSRAREHRITQDERAIV